MKSKLLDRFFKKIDTLDRNTLAVALKKIYKYYCLFELVISSVRDGVVLIDSNYRIYFANEAAEEILDLHDSHDEILWKVCPQLSAKIDIDSIAEHAISAEIELNYPQKRLLKFYSVPCDDGYIVCVFSDITNDRFQKDLTIERERMDSITLFSASIAHELGNPLNSMMLQLDLMMDRVRSKDLSAVESAIQNCQQEITRLHGIVKNFLKAVKPVKPNFEEVNLLELLHSVISFLKQELDSAKITVDVHIDGAIPSVLADIDQMKQVFFNVIKNSMEAVSCNGHLTVNFSSSDDDVIIRFTDNGIGISSQQISKIFDPFVTSKKNGNGLGMFIIQRILRDHHASIVVESNLNSGTSVLIKFPRKDKVIRKLNSPNCSI